MSETVTDSNNNDNKGAELRRKRINRMKTVIVITAVLFLILPSIFCAILGIKVNRLQKQMKDLINIHSEYGMTYDETGSDDIAYAAIKPSDSETDKTTIAADITPIGQIDPNNGQYKGNTVTENPTPTIIVSMEDNSTNTDVSMNDDNASTEGTDTVNSDTGTAITDINSTDFLTTPGYNNSNADNGTTTAETNDSTDIATSVTPPAEVNQGSSDATDQTDVSNTVTDNIDGIYKGKTVYLTFDDGPSVYTGDILDILAEYKVKATFFVIGRTDKASKDIYKRIVDEGHTLGMHSYSHKYDIIYNSVEDFDKDFTKLWNLLYDTTGYKPTIFRFPGGSNNEVNKHGMDDFIRYLNDKKIVYYDWNVVSGDATGVKYTNEQLVANVLNGVLTKKRSIVLMHDALSKKSTVDSLPDLLEKLIAGGAQILPLDNSVKPIQMIRADSIN